MSTKNVFYECPHQASCLKQGKKKLCKDCTGLNRSGVISHTANKSIHPNCDHNCPVYAVTDFESFPYSKKRSAVTSGPVKCTTFDTHPKVLLKKQEKGSEVKSATNKESDLESFKDDGSVTSSDTETRIIDQLVPKTKVDQHHSTISINHASLPTERASIQRRKRAAPRILCIENTSSCRGGNGPRTKFQVSTSADDRKNTTVSGSVLYEQATLIQPSKSQVKLDETPEGQKISHPRIRFVLAMTFLYLFGKLASVKWAFLLLIAFLASFV